jgi:hypothetical protein
MKLDVVIPAWGAGYVRRMLTYGFPTLRAAGNLPALRSAFEDVRVRIYTSPADAHAVSVLSDDGVEVNVLPSEAFSYHSGTVMRDLFQRGFTEAWNRGAAFAPVCCDAVYSDGFFRSAAKLMEQGSKAVMTQGSGINIHAFERIAAEAPRHGEGVLQLPPRWFMRRFIEETEHGRHLPTWPGTAKYPAQMFWPAGEHAFVMRCCHMYAVIIAPDHHAMMMYSHDNDLAELTLASPQSIGWMNDSDMGFFIGLSEPDHASLQPAAPEGDTSLEGFCRQWMSGWKAGYFGQQIVWHDGQATSEEVEAARRASDEIINGVILDTYRRVRG